MILWQNYQQDIYCGQELSETHKSIVTDRQSSKMEWRQIWGKRDVTGRENMKALFETKRGFTQVRLWTLTYIYLFAFSFNLVSFFMPDVHSSKKSLFILYWDLGAPTCAPLQTLLSFKFRSIFF